MNGNLQIFFYSLISAILLSLGIPNELFYFGSPLLGLFSLIPLYLALEKSTSYKVAGFAVSIQFGFTHLISSFWLANFKDFAIFTLGASGIAYFVAGFAFGFVLYLPFSRKKEKKYLIQNNSFYIPFRIIYFAAVWTVHEWYKSTGFLAYPWGTVLMSAYNWKFLTQIVSLVGTFGLSFLFSLFASVVAEGFILMSDYKNVKITGYKYTAAFCITLFVISFVYGFFAYNKERLPIKTFDAVLVQQNSDSWLDGNGTRTIEKAQKLTKNAVSDFYDKTGEKPDIVLWNEAILTYGLPNSYFYYCTRPYEESLVESIFNLGIPHLIGGPIIVDEDEMLYSNSVILFDKNGEINDWYGKIHLVPFAEAIPYADNPLVKKLMNAMVGFSSGWTPGNKLTLFETKNKNGETINFSTPICFEDAFADLCRLHFINGSEVFINLTNDSWSLTKSAEYQHFVIASYRAIAHRTTLVRSTNSGYSVVVDAKGDILDSMPLFEATSKAVTVPVFERVFTPYTITGDVIPFVALVFIFIFIFYFLKKSTKIF